MLSNREMRERLASLLKQDLVSLRDAASTLGISETRAKSVWKKDGEIETARRFMNVCCLKFNDLSTLEEFTGVDGCPDVVATIDLGPVGIELTAYTSDDSLNRLSSEMLRVCEYAMSDLTRKYEDLRGLCIRYFPNKQNPIGHRDVRSFATELLDFARAALARPQFSDGKQRRYPKFGSRSAANIFENYTLLQNHVEAVFIGYEPWNSEGPVFISPDGISTHFGTSPSVLYDIIRRKKERLEGARKDGLCEVWLLIHASGNPRSSRIAPIRQGEIEKLQAEPLRQCARDSGFDRVFVWDDVRGGSVELTSGNAHLVAGD
jgi:hypothetical protein